MLQINRNKVAESDHAMPLLCFHIVSEAQSLIACELSSWSKFSQNKWLVINKQHNQIYSTVISQLVNRTINKTKSTNNKTKTKICWNILVSKASENFQNSSFTHNKTFVYSDKSLKKTHKLYLSQINISWFGSTVFYFSHF